MHLLKYFHKAPFWPQFLIGMFAIFVLPDISVAHADSERPTVQSFAQTYVQYTQNAAESEHKCIFVAEYTVTAVILTLQAVIFFTRFAKYHQLDANRSHPIRAGPTA